MPHRIFAHLRANAVAYAALFIALGGSSYAAVRLTPGSVTTRALAANAVTRAKLAPNSVTAASVAGKSLTNSDFAPGAVLRGLKGDVGEHGVASLKGPAGPAGPAGRDGSASIGAKVRQSSAVAATKGASTSVPVSGGTWTQSSGELDFLAGSATIKIPASCTGSFGNALILTVDGAPQTFANAPTAPASATLTVPFVVGTLAEASQDTPHTLTASFGNSCTKDGEDYSVSGLNVDVVKIH
jgi:hypothetical protein